VALDSTGDEVAGSLGVVTKAIQTAQVADSADITAIKTVTDALPDAGALTSVSDETDKIDSAATDGLAGTGNSLAYRVHEAERHLHSYERWFGVAAIPNGEIHVADSITTSDTAFQMDAGNNTWGGYLQILGSSDTPAIGGSAYFDLHRMAVVAVENANATHLVQIVFGTSGAVGLAAGTYTEFVFRPQSVQGAEMIVDFQTRRIAAGTKAWIRCWVSGANTSTVDLFFGLHEYEG